MPGPERVPLETRKVWEARRNERAEESNNTNTKGRQKRMLESLGIPL